MNSSKENFNKPRILIIGSGIIGKFNAIELSNTGFEVTITDPNEINNGSNSALGILMGKIYHKRGGRSWELRKESMKLWPEWIRILKRFDQNIRIEKPLIQLTSSEKKFEKMKKFVIKNTEDKLDIIYNNSKLLNNILNHFIGAEYKGMISYEDGRVDPRILLKTLNELIKEKKIKTIKEKIIKIKKINNQWISISSTGEEIKSEIIIICNSLNALELINKESFQLEPVVGQAIEFKYENKDVNFLSLPKHFSIDGINFIPISKTRITIGSTDEYNLKPKKEFVDELITNIKHKPLWLKEENICKKWYGIRSKPIGEISPVMRSIENRLILCSGFYKNGILLAPACAKWVKNEIKKHL